jgi:cytochrome P450
MLVTIVLLTGIIGLVIVYIRMINCSYDYFRRHHICGPSFQWFFGHFIDLWSTNSFSEQLKTWTDEYGSIYGLFLGRLPMYVVSNVDFLQEVYIKQFSLFQSRHLSILLRLQTGNKIHLFRAVNTRWRRQRHVLNPTFSAAKLKFMLPLVNECISTMMRKLSILADETNSREINIYTLYKRLTMDVICKYVVS